MGLVDLQSLPVADNEGTVMKIKVRHVCRGDEGRRNVNFVKAVLHHVQDQPE